MFIKKGKELTYFQYAWTNHYTVQQPSCTTWNVVWVLKAHSPSKTWKCTHTAGQTINAVDRLPGNGVTCQLLYRNQFCIAVEPLYMRSVRPTDIHRKSQTLYTALCNGVISYGAQIGVFADHACKINVKPVRPPSSRATQHFLHVYLYCQTTVDAGDICTWWTTATVIVGKPEDPKFQSHARIKMAQVLESPLYICGEAQEVEKGEAEDLSALYTILTSHREGSYVPQDLFVSLTQQTYFCSVWCLCFFLIWTYITCWLMHSYKTYAVCAEIICRYSNSPSLLWLSK